MSDTEAILKKLISIPSFVDSENNEKELIEYIIDFIIKNAPSLKIQKQLVEKGRYNLVVSGPEKISTVLFGHMDTVLPKENTDKPFKPRIEGDKLFGLGSVDMKFGLAIMLDLIKNNHKPGVGYVFTVDEEYEFKGAFKLRENFSLKPNLIINLEPTNFKILNGCRGITEFSFVVNGKSAHSGRKTYGVNAIEKGVELVEKFEKTISAFDSKDRGTSSVNLAYLHGGMLRGKNKDGSPIISDLGMVVPNYAYLNCEIRVASDKITEKFVEKSLKKIGKEIGVSVTDIKFKFYLGSMFTPKKDLKSFEGAIKATGKKVEYGNISLSGYYEVQVLQELLGSKCVIFGAGPSEMSHATNEYVSLKSVKDTQKVVRAYIDANHSEKTKA